MKNKDINKEIDELANACACLGKAVVFTVEAFGIFGDAIRREEESRKEKRRQTRKKIATKLMFWNNHNIRSWMNREYEEVPYKAFVVFALLIAAILVIATIEYNIGI